jgi:hypothetical protein
LPRHELALERRIARDAFEALAQRGDLRCRCPRRRD